MTVATSAGIVVPNRFCGLPVLLIGFNTNLLEHHAYLLSQSSYRVTSTVDTASGMSMILNGHRFECVLVDADTCEMGLVEFLNQILKHHPKLSLIIVASNDVHMRIAKDALQNEEILWIHKPCDHTDILNILQHICRKRTTLQEDHSNGKLPQQSQALHIDDRVDPMVNMSAILDTTMVDNNILCMVSDKPVTSEDLCCNDDDQEHIDGNSEKKILETSTAQKADKGKQILEIESENDQPNEEDKFRKKRKVIEKRMTWTPDLHAKFLEALNALGNQKVCPSAIHKLMDVPGLTRNNVMSHLQIFRERRNMLKISNTVPPVQRVNNLYVWKRSLQSIQSNDDASIIHSSNLMSPVKLNFYGISYMTIDNIKTKLQEAPPLPAPLVTTTMNDFDLVENSPIGGQHNETQLTSFGNGNVIEQRVNGDHSANPAFGGAMASSGVATTAMQSDFNLDCFGIATEPLLAAAGGGNASSSNYSYGKAIKQVVTCDDSSNHDTFEEPMAPLGVVTTVQPDYNLGNHANEFWNSFEIGNSEGAGGSGVNEAPAPFNGFGIEPEDLTFPELLSYDLESLCDTHDFQGNKENLFPDIPPSTTLSDADIFMNFNLDSTPAGEENNSQAQILTPVDGSEGRVVDDYAFMNLSPDLQMTMDILDEVDVHQLINDPW